MTSPNDIGTGASRSEAGGDPAAQPVRASQTRGRAVSGRTLTRRIGAGARARWVAALHSDQSGQSMVEYAIVLFLVAVVAMVAVRLLGQGVDEVFRSIISSFRSVLPTG